MRNCVAGTLLICLFSATFVFAQNAQLGGIVSDPTNALIPGVTITVTNTSTGVVSTEVTNDSGAYTYASLQPGTAYKITASLTGFQTQTITSLELPPTSVRQNFQLKLSTAQNVVEVSADPATTLSANSATVGDVLPEARIHNLPIVGSNVLSLL